MSPLLETNSTNLTNFATFFSTVSAQNYPALKESSQKWKDLVRKPNSKKPDDGKMVVQCSERHDYGSCLPLYHLGAN
jgi:hypothetical protein